MSWLPVVIAAILVQLALSQTQPNIVLFLADDVGYGDLSCYGAPTIRTPNLDRLASEGARFTQWYSDGPLCTPSRGALLTGRLPVRLGLYTRFGYPGDLLLRVFYPSSVGSLPANETTIAHVLKQAGYFTALVGKWHLGHVDALPTRRGFDYFWGTPYSHDEGYPGPFPISFVWPPVPVYENERIIEQPVNMDTITDRMNAKAFELIDAASSSRTPFFLIVSYHEAHIPKFASAEFAGKSQGGAYGDMMQQMDASIGRILDHLKSRGLAENTLAIFTSDNGAWPNAHEPFAPADAEQGDGGSNGPFREGKGSTWEGGVREPMIFWWPNHIPSGRMLLDLGSHVDLLPTILDFVGAPIPTDRIIDGKSFYPLLTGENVNGPHEYHFYWREQILTAVRMGRYKGHFVTRTGFGNDDPVYHHPMLLYDLERDPGEQFPLNVTKYSGIVNRILFAADQHLANMEYAMPQFDSGGTFLGQDWKVIPCCSRQNIPQDFALPQVPEDWPLKLWKNCICPQDNSTMIFVQPPTIDDTYMDSMYLGQPLIAFQKFFEDFVATSSKAQPKK